MLETILAWAVSEPVVRGSVAINVLLYWPIRIDMYIAYQTSTQTFCGDSFLEAWIVIWAGVACAHLFLVFWASWWKNLAPFFIEAICWFIVLLMPEGYPFYYLFVYRHLDRDGLYALR